ncbi:MAG TPA: energy transducer TonB [Allosphingosinicella sp.]|jgi:protein TonB
MPLSFLPGFAAFAALCALAVPPTVDVRVPDSAAARPAPAPERGLEPERPPALVPARSKFPNLFAELDYPPAAIRAGEEGTVEFGLRIGPNGRVERCDVLVSSGSAILDSETCRMIRMRARFVPALDSEGRTTWDSLRGRTVWRLPR